MPKNRKKTSRSRRTEDLTAESGERSAEGFDWGALSALRKAGFAMSDAARWLGEQASAMPDRLRGQTSSELARLEGNAPARQGVTGKLPDLTAGQPYPGVSFFALVNLLNASQVHYYGVDMGTSAFTVHCAEDASRTTFGHWNSMESAFKRLDQFSGPDVHLALIVYDSVPVVALSALGAHRPQVLDTSEIPTIEGSS